VTVRYACLGGTQTCIPDGHLHRVTYTRCRIVTISSPDDEHMSARNMQRFGINIYEKRIVRQVAHLQQLNQMLLNLMLQVKNVTEIRD